MPLCFSRCILMVSLLALARDGRAQGPELRYTTELAFDLARDNVRRFAPAIVHPRRGDMVVLSGNQFIVFDSMGASRKWPLAVGWRGATDLATMSKSGWVGDSLWIQDDYLKQLVVIDTGGKVVRSIEPFSWVRPNWSDRRKYPLFAAMSWEAVYPDGSMLVIPRSRRALFDTPQFDRSRTHYLRVDRDGKILRTIARVPSAENRLTLRDGMERTVVGLPFFVPPRVSVSSDGQRVVVLQPLLTAADSGAFQVTAIDAQGDTVFTRRYAIEARRVPQADVEKALAAIKPFGRYTADWIRDTVRKHIPAFESGIMGLSSGVDKSVWIWLRSAEPGRRAFVLDSTGAAVGRVLLPMSWTSVALGVDRIWVWQREGSAGRPTKVSLVRMKREQATAARPARSGPASASPRR